MYLVSMQICSQYGSTGALFFDKGILNVLGKVLYAEKGNLRCVVLPYCLIFVTEDTRKLAVW